METDSQPLDVDKLGKYLQRHVDGFQGPVDATKFTGGQSNPTFLLTTASGRYVLRRKPPGKLLKSAHAVDREYRVLKALAATGVPVARAYHLCEDDEVAGSMFYVMSYADGRVFWDPTLPELSREQRRPVYEEIIRVLTTLHDVDIALAGLSDYGRPGSYFARQVSRWSQQYRATETRTIEAMEALIEWLPGQIPAEDDQTSLIHGDYRIDNLIFAPAQLRINAVLDWELSTLGHPLADLAYFCMCLRMPSDGHIPGLAGIDRASLGIPNEAEIVERYCSLRDLGPICNWHFYLAFSFFRLAAICQGVHKRALDGNASSNQALAVGALAEPLAKLGAELL